MEYFSYYKSHLLKVMAFFIYLCTKIRVYKIKKDAF